MYRLRKCNVEEPNRQAPADVIVDLRCPGSKSATQSLAPPVESRLFSELFLAWSLHPAHRTPSPDYEPWATLERTLARGPVT
jgi:hypothetical protein